LWNDFATTATERVAEDTCNDIEFHADSTTIDNVQKMRRIESATAESELHKSELLYNKLWIVSPKRGDCSARSFDFPRRLQDSRGFSHV
jgi:hypothetical protein